MYRGVIVSVIVVSLVFGAQFGIRAIASGGDTTARPKGESAKRFKAIGKLIVYGNKKVLVDDRFAPSGTTIFDGVKVRTLDGTRATVLFGVHGRLDLAPQTETLIRFSESQVEVDLDRGGVILVARKGLTGKVNTTQKLVAVAEAKDGDSDEATVDVYLDERGPIVNQGAAAKAGAGGSLGSSALALIQGAGAPLWLALGATAFVMSETVVSEERPTAVSAAAP